MTRLQNAAAAAAMALSVAAGAAEPDLTQWQYVAPVQVSKPAEKGVVEFALTPAVFDRARADLGDLRLLAADGDVVPYVVRVDRGEPGKPVSYTPARLFNAVFTPGVSSTVTVDFGSPASRTGVEVNTPGSDFRRRVKVEAGEDGLSWQVLRESAWLFRVGRWGGRFEQSWVELPDNDFRYLRITVFNAPDDPEQVPVVSVSARYAKDTPPAAIPVEVKSTAVSEDPKLKATEIEADLGWEKLPLYDMELSIAGANFLRRVEVLGRNRKTRTVTEAVEDAPPRTREEPEPWIPVTAGSIHRFPGDGSGALAENLRLALGGKYRYLLVRIYNEDNPPLAFKGLSVRRLPVYVAFPPVTSGPTELYLGRQDAAEPSYDLPHFIDRLRAEGVTAATLGEVVPNPRFAHRIKLAPWSERHRWLLWAALIAVGVVLAALLWRQARGAKKAAR
ncbi:MAG TPA: DUF3999 family protein [Phycisphaerae bacterium]|nr:DUF3999 family protein [Phycisphaerae bacterium]